jgi:Mg2+ and Co2+ transporter CorA
MVSRECLTKPREASGLDPEAVHGMNFGNHATNLPELTWPYAYPAVVVGMGLVTAILLVHFRREGWL